MSFNWVAHPSHRAKAGVEAKEMEDRRGRGKWKEEFTSLPPPPPTPHLHSPNLHSSELSRQTRVETFASTQANCFLEMLLPREWIHLILLKKTCTLKSLDTSKWNSLYTTNPSFSFLRWFCTYTIHIMVTYKKQNSGLSDWKEHHANKAETKYSTVTVLFIRTDLPQLFLRSLFYKPLWD